MISNPCVVDWDTAFAKPAFDPIFPEHFSPAFERGMDEPLAETCQRAAPPFEHHAATRPSVPRTAPDRNRRFRIAGAALHCGGV